MLFDRQVNVIALRQCNDFAREGLCIQLEPLRNGAARALLAQRLEQLDVAGLVAQRDHVADLDLVGRDVHLLAVDADVAVRDQLTRHGAGFAKVQAICHVVETALEQLKHIVAGDAVHVGGDVIVFPKLGFQYAVGAANLLLLAKLDAVLGLLLAALAMHSRRGVALRDRALIGIAAVALQEELRALSAALSADGTCISCHNVIPSLHSSALGRAASVVRDGRHVLDHVDLEAGGLQCADRALAAGAGSLHIHLNGAQAMLHRCARCGLGRHLRCEGRGLLRAAEAQRAGARPGDRVALKIRDGNEGVVEGGTNVRCTALDVLLLAAFAGSCGLFDLRCFCHLTLPPYFLFPPCVRFGPLRVRAFCFVLCPRTGRPLR